MASWHLNRRSRAPQVRGLGGCTSTPLHPSSLYNMLILLLGDPCRVDLLRSYFFPRITCSAGRYGVIERWSLRLLASVALITPCLCTPTERWSLQLQNPTAVITPCWYVFGERGRLRPHDTCRGKGADGRAVIFWGLWGRERTSRPIPL